MVPNSGTFCNFTMRVISRNTLKEFWLRHHESEQALKSWYREADLANWKNSHDIKREYPSASFYQTTEWSLISKEISTD